MQIKSLYDQKIRSLYDQRESFFDVVSSMSNLMAEDTQVMFICDVAERCIIRMWEILIPYLDNKNNFVIFEPYLRYVDEESIDPHQRRLRRLQGDSCSQNLWALARANEALRLNFLKPQRELESALHPYLICLANLFETLSARAHREDAAVAAIEYRHNTTRVLDTEKYDHHTRLRLMFHLLSETTYCMVNLVDAVIGRRTSELLADTASKDNSVFILTASQSWIAEQCREPMILAQGDLAGNEELRKKYGLKKYEIQIKEYKWMVAYAETLLEMNKAARKQLLKMMLERQRLVAETYKAAILSYENGLFKE